MTVYAHGYFRVGAQISPSLVHALKVIINERIGTMGLIASHKVISPPCGL